MATPGPRRGILQAADQGDAAAAPSSGCLGRERPPMIGLVASAMAMRRCAAEIGGILDKAAGKTISSSRRAQPWADLGGRHGRKQDFAKRCRWCRKAAEKGSLSAAQLLRLRLSQGPRRAAFFVDVGEVAPQGPAHYGPRRRRNMARVQVSTGKGVGRLHSALTWLSQRGGPWLRLRPERSRLHVRPWAWRAADVVQASMWFDLAVRAGDLGAIDNRMHRRAAIDAGRRSPPRQALAQAWMRRG